MGLLVFLGVAVLSAAVWHMLVQRFWPAVLGASASAVVLFQLAAWVQAGHFDPLAPVAMLLSVPPALLVTALAGLTLRMLRMLLWRDPPQE